MDLRETVMRLQIHQCDQLMDYQGKVIRQIRVLMDWRAKVQRLEQQQQYMVKLQLRKGLQQVRIVLRIRFRY